MLLLLTDRLAKLNTKRRRLVFGAFIASLLVPLSVYFPQSFFTSVLGKVLFSILIILTTFGFKSIYRMFKLLFLFYFMSFSIGGGLIAVHFLLQNPLAISRTGFLTYNMGYGDPISWIFVAISFPIVWIFSKGRMDKHAGEKIRYDALCPVTVQIKNDSHSTNGFIDSGNQLIDPFTKKPVIICDEQFLMKWFENKEWEELKYAYQHWEMNNIPKNWIDFIQVIPYHGVEGGSGFIFAIKPDLLIIHYGQQQIKTSNFLVGIQFDSLTRDGGYHCLLQPELIQSAAVYSA